MNLIINNPYRIIGIPANASAREIQGRKAKITAFARVGKEVTSEFDFNFLKNISRETEIIDKAFSDIEQNQNKVAHSLFWFINLNPVDNTAIQHLISGNKEKAIEIWEKLTDEKEVNPKNFSAFNNIGTLYLLENSKEKIKQGITTKIKLIESDNFKDFVHTVADETFSIDTNRQIELLIDELLTQFNKKFSTAETMDLFGNCSETTQKYLSKKFTEEPIHKIESEVEKSKKNRSKNKSNAYHFGVDLHLNTNNELTLLKSILGTSNLQYKMWADNVAKELLQCSIDYFNESQKQGKNNDYLEEAMKLVEVAQSIATNEATKNRIKESINTLEEMKDRELNQAIELLKSVKEAYEKNYNEIVKRAKKELGIYDEETSIIGEALNNFYETRSINYSAVDEAAKRSINWGKVVELIKETIPLRNIEKIKNSDKETKVTEFKNLMEFILTKLSFSQVNQIKYIYYWKTVTSSYPSNTSTRTSTVAPRTITSSNRGGITNWLKWVGGIALFLLIGCLIWGQSFFGVLVVLAVLFGPALLIWIVSKNK